MSDGRKMSESLETDEQIEALFWLVATRSDSITERLADPSGNPNERIWMTRYRRPHPVNPPPTI